MKDLDDATLDLRRILEPIPTGTRERPRQKPRIELALERIRTWHSEYAIDLSPRRATRGGTRAVLEAEDGVEDYSLSRRAEYDAQALARLLSGVAAICARYTVPIDTDGLPKGPPGCRSCARSRRVGDVTLPGFWNPVAERYKGRRLCNWCGEYYGATGKLPPLEAIEIYHRQTPAAAGRWLAKHGKRPTRRKR